MSVSLSGVFGFVAIIGTKAVLAFPRVTLKTVEINGKKYKEEAYEGLSTWELKEGKTFTSTSHEACEKVSQFNDYFDDSSMRRVECNEPPHGPIQYVAFYVAKTAEDDKSSAHKNAMENAPADDAKVKGAKVVK
jgi:hypothetical protein